VIEVKKGSEGIYQGTTKKRVHPPVKIATNGTSIFHGKEGWKEEDGLEL